MPGWTLDEKRFREEVFRALDNRWDPRRNLFRCLQLAPDVSDPAVIAAAGKGVRAFVNRNAKTGTNSGPAKVLLGVLDDAEKIMNDAAGRQKHRAQVLADRAELERALRAELGDLPAVPAAAVTALAATRQMFFAREDVEAALAAIGCPVRDPAELPPHGRPPATWRSVQHEVTFLGLPTLRAYLQKHFGVVTTVSAKQLDERRSAVQRTASGDALTAEMSILTNVRKWVEDGALTDLLRVDLLRELAAEASMGGERLGTALKAAGTPRYLTELGLPGPDEIAYALLCAIRYPQSAITWQSTYREARSNRDLRTARDVLTANRGSLDKQLGKELDELTATLAEVDELLARARSLERDDVEAAAELYVQIGQRSREPEAESALRRCRPAEPGEASAKALGDAIAVEWAPSTARVGEITYRVVRHVAGGGAADGVTLDPGTTAVRLVDAAAPSGTEVTYSIWTLRNGEPSSAARRTQPVALLRPVTDLELLPGEDTVELRWVLPSGASGARVARRVDGGAAEPARTVAGTGIRDTAVRTGSEYTYAVESEYRLAGGGIGHGPPVSGRVRPQEPPRPVRDLAVAVEEDALILTWTAPPRGDVHIYLLDAAPEARPGSVLGRAAVVRLGHRVRGVGAAQPGRLRLAVPSDGKRHWFLPLTTVDDAVVSGTAVEYDSRLPAVTGLRADPLGDHLQLRWTWPPRVSEVLVLSRDDAPPTGPDDPAAQRRRLTHAVYQSSGAVVAATGAEQWIGVCVTAFTDGAPVHGPVVTVSARTARELSYEIQKVGGLRKRHVRRLVIEAAGGDVGAVRVVARPRLPPLTPDEGVELARFAAPTAGSTLTGEFALTERARPLYLRAFPADGDGVVLVPAHPMQLRVD